MLWYEQVDAAADGEAEAELECRGVARKEKRWKGKGKKVKWVLSPIYKGKGISDRRGNQGGQIMDI